METSGGDEDDVNDSKSDEGSLHQNMTSASSAFQGLLRKLGAGIDDFLPSSPVGPSSSSQQNGRLKRILSELSGDGEEWKQVEVLTELSEMLSIGTEESLSTFSVDLFVPLLVGLLNHESNPDIMILAARALTHLCDALPSSCTAVVHYGAVSSFCAKLLTIEFMDVAEQCLQALKKISQDHPTARLQAGGLMVVLSYLDFFSTGVQRAALSTAANMCRNLPSDAADYVMDAVPLLTNLLQYHDSKGLIRLLSTCASGSPLRGKTFLQIGISSILKDILIGSGVSANSSVPPAINRSADQVFEIANMANELLPPFPRAISFTACSNIFSKVSIVKSPGSNSEKLDNTDENASEVSAQEQLLHHQPVLLQQFGMDLLPILIQQIYGSSLNTPVCYKCLSVIGKLVYFSSVEMIQSLLSLTNISSFLAGVLASKDPHVLVPSLKIAEILMEKLPATFSKMFIREGVVHVVDQLVLIGNQNNTPALASSVEKDNDPVSGISVEIPAANFNLRTIVSVRAKEFKDKYFPSYPGAIEVGITEELLHLKNLCMKLNAGVDDQKTKAKGKSKDSGSQLDDFSASKEIYLIGVISEILVELSKGDGVSTFEFIGSAVVAALLNFLSFGYFSKEIISDVNLPKLCHQALKRFKLFIDVALPSNVDKGSITPMTVLVQKLQNALSSLERFPVVLSHSPRSSGGNARLSFGFSALSQPCKLRLCRAQGGKSLRDYSSNNVLIDPLANLAAVEEFLWPRVQQIEAAQKPSILVGNSESGNPPSEAAASPSISNPASITRHYLSRSRSSVNIGDAARKEPSSQKKSKNSSKGKGKVVLETVQEELRGTHTRNAALDKDSPIKLINGGSTSEDEELHTSPVEMMIYPMMKIDDSLPVCMPDKVHDVKLGDSAEDGTCALGISDSQINEASRSSSRDTAVKCSDSADFRSSYGSKGATLVSAVSMAGPGTVNSSGIRGARDLEGWHSFSSSNEPPKLIFTTGGKQLKRHFTISQAIQGQLVLDEDDDESCAASGFISTEGSRLWNDIYTITYQRADSQADRTSVAGSSSAMVLPATSPIPKLIEYHF
ncbi:E3 ubiquitin-protein ligase UPL3 [Hibiscus syriacus]|uniref:HECT-type E3 ubiquitin transferase n=1 Tax=Hibiscus syriacus TaxID=106335 RepID=A0A6A3AIQ4_HIBSY|nr:E3 ubiquitin-protein ligase UPL3 [Hibiscus syriacus]